MMCYLEVPAADVHVRLDQADREQCRCLHLILNQPGCSCRKTEHLGTEKILVCDVNQNILVFSLNCDDNVDIHRFILIHGHMRCEHPAGSRLGPGNGHCVQFSVSLESIFSSRHGCY